MSLSGRLTLAAAGVVAVVVGLAATATYFLMRHELYAQVDTQLAFHASDRNAVFSDLSSYSGDYVAVITPSGLISNKTGLPLNNKAILNVATGRAPAFFRDIHVTVQPESSRTIVMRNGRSNASTPSTPFTATSASPY